ncbi:MAG: glycoside hydrolase family 3 protein [Thermotogae bacterium]|nr:glycoside hydrolase family 3 protein [Thermotogota bacterium]
MLPALFTFCSLEDTAYVAVPEITPGVIWRAFRVVERMPLRSKISQITLVYPPGVGYTTKYPIGGAVFNQRHIKLPGFPEKVAAYNRANPLPILASADQEGGRINRLKNVPGCDDVASPREMANWRPDSVEMYAFAIASTMRAVGLNVNLAPVLDVATDSSALMFRMGRTFGLGFDRARMYGRAFSRGMRRGGILTVAKHFPGYGNTRWNSDVQLTEFKGDSAFLMRNWEVFRNVSAYLDGFMVSSLIYPFLDTVPATFSPRVVEMARRIDPWKVVMTDDLWAPALREFVREDYRENFTDDDLRVIFRRAFLAGNDVLMILFPAKLPILYSEIGRLVKGDSALRKRLDSSVVRVLLMKHKAFPYLIDSLYYSRFRAERFLFLEATAWRCTPTDELVDRLRRFRFSGVVLLGGEPRCKRNPDDVARLLSAEGFKVIAGDVRWQDPTLYFGSYRERTGILITPGRRLSLRPYEDGMAPSEGYAPVIDLSTDEAYAHHERRLDEDGHRLIFYRSYSSLGRLDSLPKLPE